MNLGVGVEPVIADHGLALVGDVGSDPGNELQIIHRLQLSRLPAPPVANFALALQKQEAVQRQDGPDHVFSHPLGLELGPDTDPAVKARLEGLEPPTRCRGGSRAMDLTDER
jgi:hypothetical protein